MTRQHLVGWGVCWAVAMAVGMPTQAQTTPAPDPAGPDTWRQQRQVLSAQRQAILTTYEQQKLACWQKFAVNPCLTEARRARRQALEPIQQQELALNAKERLWRTEQRDRRLQNKSTDNQDRP